MALKILANAGYGAITNAGFRYFDVRIGEAITLTGQASDRHAEKKLNEYMNNLFKTSDVDYVTYGDSVTGDSIISVNGSDVSIEEYYNSISGKIYSDNSNKSYVKPVINDFTESVDVESKILTKNKILHVMKHKVKKEMFKITVDGKSVIVTSDHSIMLKRNNKIISVKPKDILPSDELICLKAQ
jgi:hypothetical protein